MAYKTRRKGRKSSYGARSRRSNYQRRRRSSGTRKQPQQVVRIVVENSAAAPSGNLAQQISEQLMTPAPSRKPRF